MRQVVYIAADCAVQQEGYGSVLAGLRPGYVSTWREAAILWMGRRFAGSALLSVRHPASANGPHRP